MRKTVYIFTGAEYLEIGADYFFQHPEIEALNKDSVVRIYYTSKVCLHSIKDLMKVVREGNNKVEISGTDRFTPEFVEKLEDGISFLEIMVKDLIGDEEAEKIINKPIRSVVDQIYK